MRHSFRVSVMDGRIILLGKSVFEMCYFYMGIAQKVLDPLPLLRAPWVFFVHFFDNTKMGLKLQKNHHGKRSNPTKTRNCPTHFTKGLPSKCYDYQSICSAIKKFLPISI